MMQSALRLELALIRHDRELLLSALAFAFALLAAVLAGRAADVQQAEALRRAAAAVQAEWARQPPTNPHNAAHYGILVYRAPAPLQAIEPGVLPYQGAAVFLEAHRRNRPMLSPAAVREAEGRYGGARLGALLPIAGGLFAIVIGYLIGAREVRRGMAPVLAGVGARGGAAVLAKTTAACGVVGLATIPALALAVATIAPDALPRWGVAAAASLAHLFVVAALGVAAGLWLGASRGGLAALALLWAVGAVAAPRLLDTVGERLYPQTERELAALIEADVEEGPDGHGLSPYNERVTADVLRRYGVERPEDLPVNLDGFLMQADEDHRSVVYTRRLAEADARRARQDAVRALAWGLSPTAAAIDLSRTVAGADARAQRRFDEAAEAFRMDLIRRLNMHMAENSRTGDWEWTPADTYFASFEAFRPPAPSLADDLRAAAAPAAALLGWALMAAFGLALAARRFGPGGSA